MFACSGPGADAAISESIRTAAIHAGVLVLLLVLSVVVAVRFRMRIVPCALLVLLAFHPVWTISVGGDCGGFKVVASWICTVLAGFAFLWQLVQMFETRTMHPPTDTNPN
jgi:hypothetical protein